MMSNASRTMKSIQSLYFFDCSLMYWIGMRAGTLRRCFRLSTMLLLNLCLGRMGVFHQFCRTCGRLMKRTMQQHLCSLISCAITFFLLFYLIFPQLHKACESGRADLTSSLKESIINYLPLNRQLKPPLLSRVDKNVRGFNHIAFGAAIVGIKYCAKYQRNPMYVIISRFFFTVLTYFMLPENFARRLGMVPTSMSTIAFHLFCFWMRLSMILPIPKMVSEWATSFSGLVFTIVLFSFDLPCNTAGLCA